MPMFQILPLTCLECDSTAPAGEWGKTLRYLEADEDEEAGPEYVLVCPHCAKVGGTVYISKCDSAVGESDGFRSC